MGNPWSFLSRMSFSAIALHATRSLGTNLIREMNSQTVSAVTVLMSRFNVAGQFWSPGKYDRLEPLGASLTGTDTVADTDRSYGLHVR